MSGFPLYDNLIKDLPKKDLPVKEKENFIKSISKINNEGCELIYVLIMVFAQQHKHENINIIPYNGIKSNERSNEKNPKPENKKHEKSNSEKSNFSWVLTQFPIKLRHLLSKFINMHIRKQNEENSRTTR
tara:strand:+ start:165 stop:554 length:390 start_codon:yes stop_codon:yes gene_type:complete